MTMMFRVIKDSLINNVIGPAACEKFVVVGFQRQSKNALETVDQLRTVQVFYAASKFPKSSGRLNGPTQNDLTYRVEFTVSSAAKGDLSVINDPASTVEQVSKAISDFQEASELADCSFDELVDDVYQIIMDARNTDLGLDRGSVSNRWIDSVIKDQPQPKGSHVTLTGYMELTCRTAEQVPGATGVPGGINDITIDIQDDDVERTGVLVDKRE